MPSWSMPSYILREISFRTIILRQAEKKIDVDHPSYNK